MSFSFFICKRLFPNFNITVKIKEKNIYIHVEPANLVSSINKIINKDACY